MSPVHRSIAARGALLLVLVAPLTLRPSAAAGQAPPLRIGAELFAGTPLEDYLRTLQALGDVPVHPWSLRAFSPEEVDRLVPAGVRHPWATRYDFSYRRGITLLRPAVGGRYNSAFPHGLNDGAVWAGRGATMWAEGGVAFRWGAVSGTVAPVAFWTQNASFPLFDTGQEGKLRFADEHFADIDRPQRFGDAAFGRVDAGESRLRISFSGATLGIANAHEWWGPTAHYPFLLGNNAPGFPHVFVGTSRPLNLWLARLHGRVIWGRLEQSDYFDPPPGIGRSRRVATGLAFVVQPRGLNELEFGGARFIHAPWPDDGLSSYHLTRAFEGFLKRRLRTFENPIEGDDRSRIGENQLASLFARLVLPGSGFELYGEFGREDHSWDARDLVILPDWLSSLTLGVRKSWRTSADRIVVLRGEAIDFHLNSASRVRAGSSGLVYHHGMGSNQGHTHRGQLLGAGVGSGSAAGATLGFELIDATGRWTAEWSRTARQRTPHAGTDNLLSPLDVIHGVRVERLLFRGGFDLSGGVTALHNFNRNFAEDRSSVSLVFSASGLPR